MQHVDLAQEALDKAAEIRQEVGLPFGVPVNVYDICGKLTPSVRVLFTDYSMEGCYVRGDRPLIEVSALRPIGRRAFNTAHELGHHVLGHPGTHLDDQISECVSEPASAPEEFAANAFAGFLLMPKIGVRRAFSARGWNIPTATPEQVFTVACHFGVGYLTLVNHLAYSLREISRPRAEELNKVRLPVIRRNLLGGNGTDRLWVADQHYTLTTLDTEVGTSLLLPAESRPEFDILRQDADLPSGRLFTAIRPGMTRVEAGTWAIVVCVAKYQYSGWSTNRHLELEDGDDE
ncbi:MAG: ImmA/IrrE family metallo-endopeptidase [Gemmataceae bacterium]